MKLRIVAASGDINAKQVAKAAFPDYTGRKIKTNLTGTVSFYNLNWDGGTKNEFALVRLEDLQVATGQDFAPWLNPIEGKSAKIPAGFAVVEHSFFMGKDAGITVYFSSDNLASKPTSELT
jgi:hypothetical protein